MSYLELNLSAASVCYCQISFQRDTPTGRRASERQLSVNTTLVPRGRGKYFHETRGAWFHTPLRHGAVTVILLGSVETLRVM